MKSVSKWSKKKSLAPLDQQTSSFFIDRTALKHLVCETVVEVRGAPCVAYKPGDVLKSIQGMRFHR